MAKSLISHQKCDYKIFFNVLDICAPVFLILLNKFVCLFNLSLYDPSTIFLLCRDGSSWVEPVLS